MGVRNDEGLEAREVLRGLVTGQEQVADVLQQLSAVVQELSGQRRFGPDLEEGSVHGIPCRAITPALAFDSTTRPNLIRNKPHTEEEDNIEFSVRNMTLHDEWNALPNQLRITLTFIGSLAKGEIAVETKKIGDPGMGTMI